MSKVIGISFPSTLIEEIDPRRDHIARSRYVMENSIKDKNDKQKESESISIVELGR